MNCSALHRALGVHVSYVRSTLLDVWTLRQIRRMKVGGNAMAGKSALSKSMILIDIYLFPAEDISLRYSGPVATSFKNQLDELVALDVQNFPTFDDFLSSLQPPSSSAYTSSIPPLQQLQYDSSSHPAIGVLLDRV